MAAGGGEEQGGPAAEDYTGKGQVSLVESNVSFSRSRSGTRSRSRSRSRSKLGGQGQVSGCKESRNSEFSGVAIAAIANKCIRPGPCSIDRRGLSWPSPDKGDCQQETIDKGQGACHGASRSTESASVRLGPTPSLGAILQSQHQKATGAPSASNTSHAATAATAAPAAPAATASENNKLPTAITVTITLATVAGLATLAVALLFIYSRRRQRRSGPLGPLALGASADTPSRLHRQDDAKRNSSSNSPSASAPSPLYPPPPPPPPPPLPPLLPPLRPLAASSSSSSISSSLGMGNGDRNRNGSNATPDSATLTPPPRLLERKYHSSTKSDSSIQLVKKHTHTRWGKPSSLSILSSSSSSTAREPQSASSCRPLGGTEDGTFRGARMSPGVAESSHLQPFRQPVSPMATVPPRRSHESATATTPSASSVSSAIYDGSSLTSPPRTPRQGSIPAHLMGLESPGPPPNRALPSPPPKYWQINPLSPPADIQRDHVRPEEIGIAIGSPSYGDANRREKRPRLDESDMERLGGTYSPFKR
ncbi:hypothetical protein EsDP_00001193 [Epichloe bromicola]|uniref:Uncharacterized protein n=1 Tax=Epichloe bromicola TaxID=79588 RepID=A0ABQ0CH63_9HYPO